MLVRIGVVKNVCAIVASAVVTAGIGGCKSSGGMPEAQVQPKATVLPAAPQELAALGFMSGQWVCVNPNKSVNREHWMSPLGATMLGMFQQMRADGIPTLYELTAIVVEKNEVVLYHRHLHRKLGIDERRKDVDVFKLKEVSGGKAVFTPAVDQPGGIETMTYRADGPATLVQELVFKPDSKEKNFSSVYSRE